MRVARPLSVPAPRTTSCTVASYRTCCLTSCPPRFASNELRTATNMDARHAVLLHVAGHITCIFGRTSHGLVAPRAVRAECGPGMQLANCHEVAMSCPDA